MSPCTAIVAMLAGMTALSVGCIDTGQDRTSVPLYVAGADVSQPFEAVFGVPVTVDRADLALGPLYLCAGANAGDLCETARLEWLDTVVVDATSPTAQLAGELDGVTGTVRSWMYDLGISSQLTRPEPYVLDAAQALGDTSCVLEGRAEVDGLEVPFRVSVRIQQTDETELGVPVVRKSTSDAFFRDVTSSEAGLVIRFDPEVWLRAVNFRAYVGDDVCEDGGPPVVCDGSLERTCEAGAEVSSRDCQALGSVCVPGSGCAERVDIDSDSEAFRAVRNALVSGVRPTFEWDDVP